MKMRNKRFGVAEYESAIFATTSGGKRGAGIKEKAMKINVKKKHPKSGGDDFVVLVPEGKKEDEKEEVDVEMEKADEGKEETDFGESKKVGSDGVKVNGNCHEEVLNGTTKDSEMSLDS